MKMKKMTIQKMVKSLREMGTMEEKDILEAVAWYYDIEVEALQKLLGE